MSLPLLLTLYSCVSISSSLPNSLFPLSHLISRPLQFFLRLHLKMGCKCGFRPIFGWSIYCAYHPPLSPSSARRGIGFAPLDCSVFYSIGVIVFLCSYSNFCSVCLATISQHHNGRTTPHKSK
ncbi:hypothetical protein RND81_10G133500 [Saponaria officinalis]|uniref:Uncharacterized protein n=1 Tax=Saponaria officinalis TaxID=3572 RepID=A0AAW1I1K3_SAPOF